MLSCMLCPAVCAAVAARACRGSRLRAAAPPQPRGRGAQPAADRCAIVRHARTFCGAAPPARSCLCCCIAAPAAAAPAPGPQRSAPLRRAQRRAAHAACAWAAVQTCICAAAAAATTASAAAACLLRANERRSLCAQLGIALGVAPLLLPEVRHQPLQQGRNLPRGGQA